MNYISLYTCQRQYRKVARTSKNRKNELKVVFPIIELNTFQFLTFLPMTTKSLFILVLFSTLFTNVTGNLCHFYYLLLFLWIQKKLINNTLKNLMTECCTYIPFLDKKSIFSLRNVCIARKVYLQQEKICLQSEKICRQEYE